MPLLCIHCGLDCGVCRSVIETAEKVLANKPRKGAVVSSVALSPPAASSSRHGITRKVYMGRSPSPQRRPSSSSSKTKAQPPRKVSSQVGSMQVTVSSKERKSSTSGGGRDKDKDASSKPFDLRDKLKGTTSTKPSSSSQGSGSKADGGTGGDKRSVVRASNTDVARNKDTSSSRKQLVDRKISMLEEDIFEPDYDEGLDSDNELFPAKSAGAGVKARSAVSTVSARVRQPEFSDSDDSDLDSDSSLDSSPARAKHRDRRTDSTTSEKKGKGKHKHKEKKEKHHKKKAKKEKKKHKKHKNKGKHKDSK